MEEQGGSKNGTGKRKCWFGRRGNAEGVMCRMVGPGLPMAGPTNLFFFFLFFSLLFFGVTFSPPLRNSSPNSSIPQA